MQSFLPLRVALVFAITLSCTLLFPNLVNGQTEATRRRADLCRQFPVELQAFANQKRAGDFHKENLRGNNLMELSSGKHVMHGIQFQVSDSVLLLGSTVATNLPESAQIQVGRRFRFLHVLYAAAYAVDEGQVEIGHFRLCYEDGTTHIIPIVNGKDVYAFWKRPGDVSPSHSKVGWEGSNDCVKARGFKIQLFVSTWENPRPDNTVVRIEFASAMTKAAPFCVAMTVGNLLQPNVPQKRLMPAELDRLWAQLVGEGAPVCDAIETLASAPTQAVPFIASRLSAEEQTVDQKKIADLIIKLDDDDPDKREQATAELLEIGIDASSQLRRSREESKSPEVRLRAKSLLEEFHVVALTPDQRRLEAALYVLELIPSDDARKLLNEVATGKVGAQLATEAEAMLKEMKKDDSRKR